MFAKTRIRSQMYFGVAMLLVIVTVLSAASFQGSLKFRELTKSFRGRTNELSRAANLSQKVSDLRSTIWKVAATENNGGDIQFAIGDNTDKVDGSLLLLINDKLAYVRNALDNYRFELEQSDSQKFLGDNTKELEFVTGFDHDVSEIQGVLSCEGWVFEKSQARTMADLQNLVDQLQDKTNDIPNIFRVRMDDFSQKARHQYHVWMIISGLLTACAVLLIYVLFHQFNKRIFQPLEILVQGSRVVARGRFDHRIELQSDDEMAEMAGTLNAMTTNFQKIKSDLNEQVRERTKEVVRSEKMASVGFLAAGVAHEINNPLASIAWSAESLESRLHEILNPEDALSDTHRDEQIADMKKYLGRIQDEAFRCKGITSALLDFSRMGDTKKHAANLTEIVQIVINMVRPLSKYRGRTLKFRNNPPIISAVNSQEMKQVVLNLITNALDSVAHDGNVEIRLEPDGDNALLIVSDDGCGMTDDVMQHLFEPFFTRRRDGQGTGLGLSITYQIVQEHGGTITPYSEGPGLGSKFEIRLPLAHLHQSNNEKEPIKSIAA